MAKPMMRHRWWMCLLACLLPAPLLAQDAPDTSKLWIVAGAGSGSLRGHCQDCGADFPFRQGISVTGNIGRHINSRMSVGADVFWIKWENDSGRLRATSLDAVAQFRPWESAGFFVKGGAGMALVRNFVRTLGEHPDDSKALSVVVGTGWEFRRKSAVGFQVFAMQYVGALGDLQTVNGPVPDVTGNFWSLGGAIVFR
jgi:hypothetical protein